MKSNKIINKSGKLKKLLNEVMPQEKKNQITYLNTPTKDLKNFYNKQHSTSELNALKVGYNAFNSQSNYTFKTFFAGNVSGVNYGRK
jgi:chromosomal replication initiation ATPase DnaA